MSKNNSIQHIVYDAKNGQMTFCRTKSIVRKMDMAKYYRMLDAMNNTPHILFTHFTGWSASFGLESGARHYGYAHYPSDEPEVWGGE